MAIDLKAGTLPMNTSAIELAPLTEADAPTLFEWINDRALVTLSAPYRPVDELSHQAWFKDITARSDRFIFAIRENGALVGSGQILNVEKVHRSGELQIRIGNAGARGRGIGTLAVRALINFAFQDLNLHRLYLHVLATNELARRAYVKAGFTDEGRLREAAFIDGTYVDVFIMGVLKHDRDASGS